MPKGYTLWFTGLSGSGKSTLAHAVAQELMQRGRIVDILDGDVVRTHLSKELGFSREDRNTNIRRIGFVAYLITRHGGVAITAAISPYRSIRDENRKLIGNFVEIYCKASVETCELRDIKGLYAKARQAQADGKPMGFTGVDDPYEEPRQPEISVDSGSASVADCVAHILKRLGELGYLDGAASGGAKSTGHHEYLPPELVTRAEGALKKAGCVHTSVLMHELHVGFDTAARLLDKLAEENRIVLKQEPTA